MSLDIENRQEMTSRSIYIFPILQSAVSHTSMASHITSYRPKVVLTRDLGPDSMSLLQQKQVELEASLLPVELPSRFHNLRSLVILVLVRLLCGTKILSVIGIGCFRMCLGLLRLSCLLRT